MGYPAFPKIPRLNRDIVITEKIDGTNGQVYITEPGEPSEAPLDKLLTLVTVEANTFGVSAGSRKRWVTPDDDNFGFAAWVQENAEELVRTLGPGRHYGEWWGHGIQRGYNRLERYFSLFNTKRWGHLRSSADLSPGEFGVLSVPVIYTGPFSQHLINDALASLMVQGSHAAPGYDRPEGVVVYHTAGNHLYKVTLEG